MALQSSRTASPWGFTCVFLACRKHHPLGPVFSATSLHISAGSRCRTFPTHRGLLEGPWRIVRGGERRCKPQRASGQRVRPRAWFRNGQPAKLTRCELFQIVEAFCGASGTSSDTHRPFLGSHRVCTLKCVSRVCKCGRMPERGRHGGQSEPQIRKSFVYRASHPCPDGIMRAGGRRICQGS